jgi:hypothetical protein
MTVSSHHFRVRASCLFSLLPELYLPDSTSLRFVYASVDPDGTPGYLPYFRSSGRFCQYSLVTIARTPQRDRQRSHFATKSQGQRIRQRFVSLKRGHSTKRSACTCEAESARLVSFLLSVSSSNSSHQGLQSQAVTTSRYSVLDAKVCLGLTVSSSARRL